MQHPFNQAAGSDGTLVLYLCPCLLQELGILLHKVDGGEVALEEVLGDPPDTGAAVETAGVPGGVVEAEETLEAWKI